MGKTTAELALLITANFKDFQSNLDRSIGSFKKFGSDMQSVGSKLSLGLTLPLVGLGVAATDSAMKMDSLMRGLTAVSGSSEAAADQFERLKEVAKLPGLGLEEAVQGSINLQAAGFSAEQAESQLKAFGNALATVGKGKAELDGVILALGQIKSKGKISAEEINQLAERVPQIRQAMVAAFGTGDTEVLQGLKISADEFVDGVTAKLAELPPVTGGLKRPLPSKVTENPQTSFNG